MDFESFKDEAANLLNINFDGYKLKRVQRRTDSLMRRHNVNDYQECINKLKKDNSFKDAYLNHFTINTSEFFRNPKSFDYLKGEVLPNLINKNNRKIKIWSAPCSNGSEPYTIAIILNELGISESNFEILASDLDKEILQTAKNGQYSSNSLKNVPDNIMDKYFNPVPGEKDLYQLAKKIKRKVKFEKKDLINDSYSSGWDLILSRNFFIYLTKEQKDILTEKFTKNLKNEGYLFLGNTEFIFNPGKFNLNKIHLSFYQNKI
ncbi:MAG: CheR family methyltransferase [Bacillota bacterium]